MRSSDALWFKPAGGVTILELRSMRLGNWAIDATTVTLALLGVGFGVAWAVLDLFAYTQGWPQPSVSGEGVAAPSRDVFGLLQILFYLPAYLTVIVLVALHLGGTVMLGLGVGVSFVLGCLCALALLWDRPGQVALGLLLVSVAGALLLAYGRG